MRRFATPYLLLVPALAHLPDHSPSTRYFASSRSASTTGTSFPVRRTPSSAGRTTPRSSTIPSCVPRAFNSFLFIVITVPIQMAIGLFAAAVLTDRLPGSMFWRAAVYIPVVTSWVVVSWVFSYIFASQGGLMNAVVGLVRRPHREHRLDRADLDGERRHMAPQHLEGCRLVVHHLPGRARRHSTPTARVGPDRRCLGAPGLALRRPAVDSQAPSLSSRCCS